MLAERRRFGRAESDGIKLNPTEDEDENEDEGKAGSNLGLAMERRAGKKKCSR